MEFGFPNILHNFECWINNEAKLGMASSVQLEGLEHIQEEHIGGGMTGKMPIEFAAHEIVKWQADFIDLATRDIALFSPKLQSEEIQFRGAVSAQGGQGFDDCVLFIRSKVNVEIKEMKAATMAGVKLTGSARYLHIMRGGRSVLKLDPGRGIWNVNGINQMRGLRQALGFGG